MHCLVEGEASSIHIPNPGSRTAGTLSFFYPFPVLLPVAWPRALQKPCWSRPRNASRFLRTGQARYCVGGSCTAEIHGKKIRLLAGIVLGTWLQTELPAVTETTLGPSASKQGAMKAMHSPSCSSLQEMKLDGAWGDSCSWAAWGRTVVTFLCFTPCSTDSSLGSSLGMLYNYCSSHDSCFLGFGQKTLIIWFLLPLEQGGANPGVHCFEGMVMYSSSLWDWAGSSEPASGRVVVYCLSVF